MEPKEQKRTIVLPPVGNQKAELEITLRTHKASAGKMTTELYPAPLLFWELSVCGTIYEKNRRGRWEDVGGGQNIEEIATLYSYNRQVQRVAELWRAWHLNDLKAGTTAQDAAIDQHQASYLEWRYEYGEACEILKAAGLYEDRGYKYGSQWLLHLMPYDVKKEILEIIKQLQGPEGEL